MIPKLAGYDLPACHDDLPKKSVGWDVDSSRAALLIHDMQNYFLDFWGNNSPFVKELVSRVKHIRALCKSQGIPVYYTAQPINQSKENRALLTNMWGPGIDQKPERQSIIDDLTPEEDDTQLVKWRYSAFKRSPLQALLKEQGRDQLIICGIYAHIGCLQTAMDAFMEDIKPFLVADALGDFSLDQHKTALNIGAECCAQIMLTSELTKSIVDYELKKTVASVVEADASEDEYPEEDDNLVDYGLDSVKIMALAGRWRRVRQSIDFVTLAQNPTIGNWRKLLNA